MPIIDIGEAAWASDKSDFAVFLGFSLTTNGDAYEFGINFDSSNCFSMIFAA
jgi:hypothetical protein